MTKLIARRVFFAVGFTMTIVVSTAWADLIVDRSNVTSIKEDAKFPDNHEFDLPPGSHVELTQNPTGIKHVLDGRYRGTVDKYVSRCRDGNCARGPKSGGTKGGANPPE